MSGTAILDRVTSVKLQASFRTEPKRPNGGASWWLISYEYALPSGTRRKPLSRIHYPDRTASEWRVETMPAMTLAEFTAWAERSGCTLVSA